MKRRNKMMRLLRWGFPVALLIVWALGAGYTLSALIGMDSALQATQGASQPAQVTVVARPPLPIEAPNAPHAS
jgi:hypothetical protein